MGFAWVILDATLVYKNGYEGAVVESLLGTDVRSDASH